MCKILIAEDDPLIRNLFKEILIRNGYDIVEAVDGEDALIVYDKLHKKPDIIIVDFRMPKINGLELTQEILSRDPNSNIIMVTGDPAMNQEILNNSGVIYKEKPVNLDEFLKEIHSLAELQDSLGDIQ